MGAIDAELHYPDGMSVYAYAAGNPITMVDPTGSSALWTAWGTAGFPQAFLPQAGGYLIGQMMAHLGGWGPDTLSEIGDEWMKKWGPGWYEGDAEGVAKWLVQDVATEFWDDIIVGGATLAGKMAPGRFGGAGFAARYMIEQGSRWSRNTFAAGGGFSALGIATPVLFGAGMYAGVLDSVMWTVEQDMGYSGGNDDDCGGGSWPW